MNLREYLFYNKITVKDFADKLGYSRSYISGIVHELSMPSPRLAKEIEKVTQGKIKASSWKKKNGS